MCRRDRGCDEDWPLEPGEQWINLKGLPQDVEVWEADNEPTAILYAPDGETVIAAIYPRPVVFGFARYLAEKDAS